jgi:hypothetical protein
MDKVDIPLEFLDASNTQFGSSSTSKMKKKKMSSYEKNPDYPRKTYGHFIREVALKYYKRRTLDSL